VTLIIKLNFCVKVLTVDKLLIVDLEAEVSDVLALKKRIL
jgi:hypothetical protein